MLNFSSCLENGEFSWKSAWKWQVYPWKIKRLDILLFFMFLYLELSWINLISMGKMSTKSNFPLPVLSGLWLDGKLHQNYRFCRLTLYFFTSIHLERPWKRPWKCPWKSPWKVLEFFFWKPVLTMLLPLLWNVWPLTCYVYVLLW